MKLHILKNTVKRFLFSSALLVSVQALALDPRVKLNKISSDHFDIIYDAKSYELAKIYLEEAERSYQILVDVFGVAPEKTTVVLDDTYDLANGSATGVPRPHVNIYTAVPTSLTSIDHYNSWPRDVFLHEYAHILNMEPARGVVRPLRFIFGSFMRPNMFLPRWYLEGLAVEMESRFNEFGRLKSTDYDAMMRALYLDSKWGSDNLSAINEVTTPTWPRGQRPYFYGALLWHEMVQSKSISLVRTFNDRYGGRAPWVITAPMVEEFGKTYQDFLRDVYQKYSSLIQKQILKIQEQPITKGDVILTKNGVSNHSPEISPDGEKLLFVSQNKDGDSVLYVFKRLGEQWVPVSALNPTDINTPLEEVEKNEIQRASWFPNSQKIVFDSVDDYNFTYYFYDLYTYDLNEKKPKQLTKGLRAREPAVSPDGKTILFVKAGQGKTNLSTVDSEGNNEKLVYAPPGYERVSRPVYLNDKEIIFSQKNLDGKDRLHLFNLETRQITKVLDLQAKYPVLTAQGIVISSNQTGVENLYLVSKDLATVKPLTNSLTRTINGTIDPKTNKLVYSELTGDGPQIKQTVLSEIKILPPVAHPIAGDFKEKIQDAPTLDPQAKSYHAFPYMFPQLWLPWISMGEDGTIASVTIPGSDPTGFHSYILDGQYHSKSEKFSTFFLYAWKNPIGTTVLTANDRHRWFASLEETTHSQMTQLYHGFHISGLSSNWTFALAYEYKKSNLFVDFGSGPEKINYYFHGPTAGVSYSNMEKKDLDISSHGQMAKLSYTHYSVNRLDDYGETFVQLGHSHTKWLPDRHVLALSAQSVITERNRPLLLGTTSTEGEYTLGESSGFITRGYPVGQFIGYTLASGVIEYRFPIAQKWKGPDSPAPYFVKRIHGGIFAETLTLDGIYFSRDDDIERAKLGKYFTSVGAELKMDTTLLYHVPVTLKIVLAKGLNEEAGGDLTGNFVIGAPQAF